MLFRRIKRTGPDTAFVIVRNNDSTALQDGDVCIWDQADALQIGVNVKGSTTVDSQLFAGVAQGQDLNPGDYGPIQCYGYHGNVKGVTAGTVGTGTKISGTARTATDGVTADAPMAQFGVCLLALATGRMGVFIRGM